MAVRILTDSSADFDLLEATEKGILFVPITINIGDESFADGVDITKEEFFVRLERGESPTTALPSPNTFLTHFLDAKESGDEVVAIVMSSGISGTVQSAFLAKELADYNGIFVIDSLRMITGLRMLVDIACDMRDRGCSAIEIVNTVESLKLRVRIIAVVDTLEHLHKGGRLTKAQAMIGEMTNLKILIYIDDEGTVQVLDKCIGRERASRKLLSYFNEDERDENYPIYFPYARYSENGKRLFAAIKEQYPDTEELFFNLGPTVATHIGENAFGLTYILKE